MPIACRGESLFSPTTFPSLPRLPPQSPLAFSSIPGGAAGAEPELSGGREWRQLTWRQQPTRRGQHDEASTMAAAAPARGPSGL